MSFRTRLTLTCATGIALVLLVGSAATYLTMRNQLLGEIDRDLASTAADVFVQSAQSRSVQPVGASEQPLQPGTSGSPTNAQRGAVEIVSPAPKFGTTPYYVSLSSADGKVTLPPDSKDISLPTSTAVREVAAGRRGAYTTDIHVRGVHLRMRVRRTPAIRQSICRGQVGTGNVECSSSVYRSPGALLVARPMTSFDQTMNRLGWSLGLTGAIGALFAALVGAVVARSALKPVRQLSATAERVSSTRDLTERIHVTGHDELGRLGTAFNGMLDSLDQSLRSQRRLVADASHELRTPLTSLRTNVEVLREGVPIEPADCERLLHDIDAETQELTGLVENLVQLARGSQRDLHLEQLRLDQIATTVVDRARVRYPGLKFELSVEPTTVWGDRQDLDRATWNLVENAAKWSGDQGLIEVEVGAGEISIRDHGPGINPTDLPFVFDRFYRAETASSKPGSGLGLAIVREIAETHGGTVQAETPHGGGALLRLTLVEAG
jgi:two-component system sensor histidine kinase MprB